MPPGHGLHPGQRSGVHQKVFRVASQRPEGQATSPRRENFWYACFSVAEQPDKISDTKLNEVLTKASIGVTAAVRRLAFEGLTYSLQDIRICSELDHAATRPVPTGEREDLRKTQVTKLKGILIEGELEPAFALVDKAAAMLGTEL